MYGKLEKFYIDISLHPCLTKPLYIYTLYVSDIFQQGGGGGERPEDSP